MFQQAAGHVRVASRVHEEVRLHQEPVPVEEQHVGDAVHGGRHIEAGAVEGEGPRHLLGDQVGPLAVEGEEQLVEAGEVGVEGASAVAGGLADLLDGDVPEALGREHGERRVQEVGPCAHPAPGHTPGRSLHGHVRPPSRYMTVFDTPMYRKPRTEKPSVFMEHIFD